MIQVLYVILWWLALVVIGLVSFPLVSRVCGGLKDKGYSISKLVGLVILTFLVWMISSLRILPFGYASIVISFLLLAALSLFFGRNHLRPSDWPRKSIIISESVFAAAFVLFLLIMMGNPDIYHYMGDYYANFHFLSSITRGGYFPPIDSWFAGESTPYYYGGHLLVAVLTMATKVPPAIAFNIAGAMFAAVAICASYGLGYNITHRKLYGFLTAFFVCAIGYIAGAFQFLAFAVQHPILGYGSSGPTAFTEWWLNFDFWTAPSMVEGSWVGYPYFKFLNWDMHSYMMSIPFQLMFIMLIFALFQRSRLSGRITRSDTLLDIFVLGMCLGFFCILNTWEYPTYIIFTILAFVLLRIRPTIRGNLAVSAAIIGLSFVLYIPHYASGSVSGFSGLGLVATRTSLAQFIEFGALFLFATCSLLFILVLSKRDIFWRRTILVAIFTVLATILAAVLLHFQLLIVVVPLGLVSLYCVYRHETESGMQFVLVLLIMSLALVFFCDFIYVDDALGGEWERWNTVTKVYMQMWVFLAIPAAYAVFYVVNNVGRKTKVIWVALLAILILACLIHPVALTTSALSGRHTFVGLNRGTLDGMAYIKIVDKGDYDAIRWINEEINGSPVIVEAPAGDIEWSTRVSTFTGLPTIVGYGICEITWGRSWDEVWEREADVKTIYSTLNNDEALELLQKYDVEYVYVGTIEQDTYDAKGLQKFTLHPEDYDLVYDGERVTIYRVME